MLAKTYITLLRIYKHSCIREKLDYHLQSRYINVYILQAIEENFVFLALQKFWTQMLATRFQFSVVSITLTPHVLILENLDETTLPLNRT
jgi:hypothetical protein